MLGTGLAQKTGDDGCVVGPLQQVQEMWYSADAFPQSITLTPYTPARSTNYLSPSSEMLRLGKIGAGRNSVVGPVAKWVGSGLAAGAKLERSRGLRRRGRQGVSILIHELHLALDENGPVALDDDAWLIGHFRPCELPPRPARRPQTPRRKHGGPCRCRRTEPGPRSSGVPGSTRPARG